MCTLFIKSCAACGVIYPPKVAFIAPREESRVSGEGIRPAIESGLLAAQVLLDADNDPAAVAAQYAARLQMRMGLPRENGLIPWLPSVARSWLGRKLLGTSWFTRHVVLDRWFLDVNQPALSR